MTFKSRLIWGVGILGVSASMLSAQTTTTEQKKTYKLPGFEDGIPTGIEINPAARDADGNIVKVKPEDGMSGPKLSGFNAKLGVTGQFLGQFGDLEDAMLGNVYVMGSISLGDLSVETGISLEDLVNEFLDSDWEKTRARTNGITSSLAPDTLNKLRVVLTPFKYSKDGKTLFALTLVGGRDRVTPLGTTVQPEWQLDLNTLIHRELGEQDLIKVRADIAEMVYVEVVNYGYDVFGNNGEGKDFIKQEGNGDSFAINVGTVIKDLLGDKNNLEIWYSYADTKDGVFYTRALQNDQPGANKMHSVGLKMNIEKFTLAGEGYVMSKESGGDDEWGGEVRAQYEIDRLIPYVGVGFLSTDNKTDLIYRAGIGYRLAKNVMASVGLEYVTPDSGDSTMNFYAGVTIMENLYPIMAADKKEG